MATITLRSTPTEALTSGATVKGSPLTVLQVDDNFNRVNAALLQNITVNGSAVQLGGSITVTANTTNALTAGTGITSGGTFNGSAARTFEIDTAVVATLTGTQTLTNKTISGSANTISNIANASLTNSSVTINGTAVSLGGSVNITANTTNALTIGTGLTGTSFNGSGAITIAVDDTAVVRMTGNQTIGGVKTFNEVITGSISGNAGTVTNGVTLAGTQTLTNKTISGSLNTISNIANSALTNSSVTINGSAVSLGASATITANTTNALTAGTGLTSTGTFNGSTARTFAIDSTVATLTGTQTLTNKTINGSLNTISNIGNGSLTNSSVTINGTAVSLGASATIKASTTSALTIGAGLSGTSFDGSGAVTIAIDSTVATLTGTQTLTNKTISSASNTILYNEHMILAVSDETTAITTGTSKITFRAPFAMTLVAVPRASLSTASTANNPTIDINVGGASIFNTQKLYIPVNVKTSKDASGQATLLTTSVADDAEITIDIDAAGTGAKGLKVTLYFRRTA